MAAKTFTVTKVDKTVAAGLGTGRTSKKGAVATRDAARLPHQFDPASLGTTPADRLAGLEDIIEAARQDAAETVKAAKTRFELRAGMALEMIRSEPILFTQKGYADFRSYVKGRWGYSLSRAYQLMDMVLVMTAVSTIVETLPESQVRLLAVVVRQHGEDAAREILSAATALPGAVTAKRLAQIRDQLDYAPAARGGEATGQDDGPQILDAELVDEIPAQVQSIRDGLAALNRAHQLLTAKNLTAALQYDPDLGDAVLAGYERSGDVRRRLRRSIPAPTTSTRNAKRARYPRGTRALHCAGGQSAARAPTRSRPIARLTVARVSLQSPAWWTARSST
ncbi:hypothetical protein ACWC5I_43840 [Kitasatospora sp. NPDC001574]